jgi:predicted choloylglycine hydrolase
MCTTATKEIDGARYLIKTRDPVSWMRWDDEIKLFNNPNYDKFKKLIVQNPDQNQDGFYGGINEKGVAIVATYVKVSENGISYLRKPYIRLILDASTAKEAVEIIKNFSPRIGGNIFVADKNECYGIEAVPEEYFIEEVENAAVKTNHFIHLNRRPIDEFLKEWSQDHYNRAEELINSAASLEDLKNILRDRENSDKKTAICTVRSEDACFTYSAFIFDCTNIKAYYCQGNPLENEFVEYGFN